MSSSFPIGEIAERNARDLWVLIEEEFVPIVQDKDSQLRERMARRREML